MDNISPMNPANSVLNNALIQKIWRGINWGNVSGEMQIQYAGNR